MVQQQARNILMSMLYGLVKGYLTVLIREELNKELCILPLILCYVLGQIVLTSLAVQTDALAERSSFTTSVRPILHAIDSAEFKPYSTRKRKEKLW